MADFPSMNARSGCSLTLARLLVATCILATPASSSVPLQVGQVRHELRGSRAAAACTKCADKECKFWSERAAKVKLGKAEEAAVFNFIGNLPQNITVESSQVSDKLMSHTATHQLTGLDFEISTMVQMGRITAGIRNGELQGVRKVCDAPDSKAPEWLLQAMKVAKQTESKRRCSSVTALNSPRALTANAFTGGETSMTTKNVVFLSKDRSSHVTVSKSALAGTPSAPSKISIVTNDAVVFVGTRQGVRVEVGGRLLQAYGKALMLRADGSVDVQVSGDRVYLESQDCQFPLKLGRVSLRVNTRAKYGDIEVVSSALTSVRSVDAVNVEHGTATNLAADHSAAAHTVFRKENKRDKELASNSTSESDPEIVILQDNQGNFHTAMAHSHWPTWQYAGQKHPGPKIEPTQGSSEEGEYVVKPPAQQPAKTAKPAPVRRKSSFSFFKKKGTTV